MQSTSSYTNIIGTIGYMPPEQIAGQPSFASDIYALGKTIIYALTGQSIDDEDSSNLKVANQRILGRLSPKLTNVLNTMTKQNCDRRYQSVADVLSDLNTQEFSLPTIYPNTFGNNNRNSQTIIAKFNTNFRARIERLYSSKLINRIAIAAIAFLSIILIFNLGLFFGNKSSETKDFLTYENTSYNFKIKYPKSWQKQDIDDPITGEITAFVSENETNSDLFQERVIITIENLSTNTKNLEDYKEEIIDKLSKQKKSGLTIEEERSTKLSNRPAHKVVYSRQDNQIDMQQMEVFTVENERAYVITYSAERAKYSKFLATAQEIIRSFEFK
jgi:serine/threonine-protein kinase